jgi:hypothetical protein
MRIALSIAENPDTAVPRKSDEEQKKGVCCPVASLLSFFGTKDQLKIQSEQEAGSGGKKPSVRRFQTPTESTVRHAQ